jgi:hypothetical protein
MMSGVEERWTRTGPMTLGYEVTIEDPTVWTLGLEAVRERGFPRRALAGELSARLSVVLPFTLPAAPGCGPRAWTSR